MRGVGFLVAGLVVVTGATAAPAEPVVTDSTVVMEGVSVDAVVVAAPVTVELVASDVIAVGRPTRFRAVVVNHSTVSVSNLEVSLLLGEPFVVLDDADASVLDIRPNSQRQLGWRVCATAAGNAIGMTRVRGLVPGGQAFEVTSVGVVVEAKDAPGRSSC